MHPSAFAFASRALGPAEVKGKTVIEAGGMNVNGSVRPVIEAHGPAAYISTDMRPGPGVDVMCAAETLPGRFGAGAAEVVISTEMLEHAADWQAAMAGLIELLAPGGVLVLTTRGPGFPVHGYPEDHWRFTTTAMWQILAVAGLVVEVCRDDDDPASPGVFTRARKPDWWKRPPDLESDWNRIEVGKPS